MVTFVRLCLILIEENVGVVCKKYFVNAYNKNIRNLEELKDEDRKTAEVGSGSYVLHAILKNPVCGNLAGRGMYSVHSNGAIDQQINYSVSMFDLDMQTYYKNHTPNVIHDSIIATEYRDHDEGYYNAGHMVQYICYYLSSNQSYIQLTVLIGRCSRGITFQS